LIICVAIILLKSLLIKIVNSLSYVSSDDLLKGL
jgi:hypothetical protein